MIGLVYVNHGRVIVDCPGACNNAYPVTPHIKKMRCVARYDGCGAEFSIAKPDNLQEIVQELSRRPKKENQNWYPEGHPTAVRSLLTANPIPMNQSVADLAAEFELGSEGKLDLWFTTPRSPQSPVTS